MDNSMKSNSRSERDFSLVRSFFIGRTGDPYKSEREARAGYYNLNTENPDLESSLSDQSNKVLFTLNKLYDVVGKYIQTHPRPLTEDGERKRDFNMVGAMYQTLAKNFGLEGAEQFLRFYYPNLDFWNPDQRRQSLKYLNYAVKGLTFQDFLIDREIGIDQMSKSDIGSRVKPQKVLKQ